ncbi:MAG TPA: membrane-bound O-acyltransferase family protein, partial [Acidimicrobiaceae bacterium]|nr:membrane-bound O-acyltransferase family protein [Acidimicrobiaceae bacterium]
MFGASLFFYGWWNWRFVFLLMWAISSNWLVGTQIDKNLHAGRKQLATNWMRTAIVGDLLLLGVFKYYDFFAVELSNILGGTAAIPLLELTLPVGISFFT